MVITLGRGLRASIWWPVNRRACEHERTAAEKDVWLTSGFCTNTSFSWLLAAYLAFIVHRVNGMDSPSSNAPRTLRCCRVLDGSSRLAAGDTGSSASDLSLGEAGRVVGESIGRSHSGPSSHSSGSSTTGATCTTRGLPSVGDGGSDSSSASRHLPEAKSVAPLWPLTLRAERRSATRLFPLSSTTCQDSPSRDRHSTSDICKRRGGVCVSRARLACVDDTPDPLRLQYSTRNRC